MGRYTKQSEPLVDQKVESHMQKIITAITSQMDPQSIILRGSFGRGEGSVLVDNKQIIFISDYEIDVATLAPFYRSTFARLSRQLTDELGVETSVRWVRPDYLYNDRIGPFPAGPAPISISLYESRYGSQILFGQDIVSKSPNIDPCQIRLTSAHELMLNRMAESLYYLPAKVESGYSDIQILHWVNKVVLACAESLLLLWREYHFSYRERGNRFAALSPKRLGFMEGKGTLLTELVARAIEFKLQPARDIYPGTIQENWQIVGVICDSVFRHITEKILGFSFDNYAEYPKRHLGYWSDSEIRSNRSRYLALKLLEFYKYLRIRTIPKGLLLPFNISHAVYAIVPPMFNAMTTESPVSSELIREIRRYLNLIIKLESINQIPAKELEFLRKQTLWAWKNFCYL